MSELIVGRYLPFLKAILTPKRLEHSLGVMQVMGELAEGAFLQTGWLIINASKCSSGTGKPSS
jgi:HD superfamily phosphohydrolase